jgi:hypothetical protein
MVPGSRTLHAGNSLASGVGAGPSWQDLFTSASPSQQQELLALARRQGVLYTHQVAAADNNGSEIDRARHLLSAVLGGNAHDLAPVRVDPIAVMDTDLDDAQREAVARALASPDFCLLQGLPGTGKSRVVAEIVTQAAARGERVLLLAPNPAAVDRVLELVAGCEVLCAVRCLEPDTVLETMPPAARACTVRERLSRLRHESLPRARQDTLGADERAQRLRRSEALWPRLLKLAEQCRDLDSRREALDAARVQTAAQVEQESERTSRGGAETSTPAHPSQSDCMAALGALAAAREESTARRTGELAKARAAVADRRAEQQKVTGVLEALQPLADAWGARRFWSAAWWRALFTGDVCGRVMEMRSCLRHLQTDLQALEQDVQHALAEQEEAQTRFEAERCRLSAVECARRHALLDEQQAALKHDRQLLEEKWQGACRELQPASAPPVDQSSTAVAAARAAWREALRQEEEQAAFARHWLSCLEEVAESFATRILGLCNLVAGTPAALADDPDVAGAGPLVFDRLVLEEADSLTEAEFLAVARRARRWLLVGQPAAVSAGAPPHRPGMFERLWEALHCDPRRLPYAWVQERNALCCRLRPVTSEQSQWLESERLADFPDIQLRILAMPHTEPLLAEVVFPASLSIAQAKEFIFRELEQLPVRALGHSLRWHEEAERVVLRLTDTPAPAALPVDLEPGVREMLDCCPQQANGGAGRSSSWNTCCLEFDRRAGWQRSRAEEWVRLHLGLRDLGRTARLDIAYRMRSPELAAFLADLLFAGHAYKPAPASGAGAVCASEGEEPLSGDVPVEFIPVPPLGDDGRTPAAVGAARRGGQGRASGSHGIRTAPPRKGGAGLELDLADPRHRSRLPAEFACALPNQGMVNYLEAQAVVRALETLAVELARDGAARPGGIPALGVVALYPAQASLIRLLMQQSPSLAAADVEVVVDSPTGFRQRECLIVLLSLTRSHTHRAVPYGEGPDALALALTRARDRLIVFGDAGTLARRCRWETALDPLDEAASARERALLSALVAYVQGDGPHRHAFRVREGSPA